MKNTDKITLTIGQLKRLITEDKQINNFKKQIKIDGKEYIYTVKKVFHPFICFARDRSRYDRRGTVEYRTFPKNKREYAEEYFSNELDAYKWCYQSLLDLISKFKREGWLLKEPFEIVDGKDAYNDYAKNYKYALNCKDSWDDDTTECVADVIEEEIPVFLDLN